MSLYLRYIHDKTGNNPVRNRSKENARSDWFKPARQKPALLCTCLRLHDHSFIHSFIQVNQVVVKTSPVEKQLVLTQIMLGYVIYDRVTDSRSGTLFSL